MIETDLTPPPILDSAAEWIAISERPLPVDDAWKWANLPGCGGIVTFCGAVRDNSDARTGVTSLEYEAYEEQVVPRLTTVAETARVRWPEIGRLVLLHRVGRLTVGEIAVVVVDTTPQRGLRGCPILHRHPQALGAHLEARDLGRRIRLGPLRARATVIPLNEAQNFVLGLCQPLPSVELPLDEVLGCVLAQTVVATEQVPRFANSSMDGYALRAADTDAAPVTLSVVGSIMAGHVLDRDVGPGEAVRIMTGAPVPSGADAVCMIEEAEAARDGTQVVIRRRLRPGDFVRQPGLDVDVGEVIASEGTVLSPAHLGVLANQGAAAVTVHPRPRVGVLSTGDELFAGTGPLPPGKIRDANRHSLMALLRREGCDCTDLGIVGDDESALVEILKDASRACDAIVTSGGVSVGDLDIVRIVLEKLSGGRMRWMQVAIRPAKPLAFGVLEESGTPVFGLPGNPVSAMVSFELFVRPALRQLGGNRVLDRAVVTATAESDLPRKPDGKLHLMRAHVSIDPSGLFRVRSTSGQESHQLHSMSESNALILLPDGEGVAADERVTVMLIDTDQLGSGSSFAPAAPEEPKKGIS
jgi:molybdopterin molybdotransferase